MEARVGIEPAYTELQFPLKGPYGLNTAETLYTYSLSFTGFYGKIRPHCAHSAHRIRANVRTMCVIQPSIDHFLTRKRALAGATD